MSEVFYPPPPLIDYVRIILPVDMSVLKQKFWNTVCPFRMENNVIQDFWYFGKGDEGDKILKML